MNETLVLQFATGAAIGLGAGYLGSLMVLRRMSLVGDALSHVALPGIAVALSMGIDPFIGAFAALITAIAGIWWLGNRTSLPSETLVGIFFTLALAIGLLITPEPELLEALFGDITQVTAISTLTAIVLTGFTVLVVHYIRPVLILDILSPDLARTAGPSVSRSEFVFLFLVALIVALGLRIAGTLLTGSLVIIPAAAARNIAPSLVRYSRWSSIFGAVSAVAGIALAHAWGMPPGPLVVIAGGLLFVISLLFRKRLSAV